MLWPFPLSKLRKKCLAKVIVNIFKEIQVETFGFWSFDTMCLTRHIQILYWENNIGGFSRIFFAGVYQYGIYFGIFQLRDLLELFAKFMFTSKNEFDVELGLELGVEEVEDEFRWSGKDFGSGECWGEIHNTKQSGSCHNRESSFSDLQKSSFCENN